MRKRPKLWGVAAVLVALLGAGGYIAWFHLWPGSHRMEVVGDDPVILVWQKRYEGMHALAQGTIHFDAETKCLVLEGPSSDSALHLVWPRGTSPVIVDGRRGVRVRGFLGRVGGTILLDGDRLSLEGGGLDVPEEVADRSGCDADSAFLINGDSGSITRH